jgi:hypothetical protein
MANSLYWNPKPTLPSATPPSARSRGLIDHAIEGVANEPVPIPASELVASMRTTASGRSSYARTEPATSPASKR